MEGCEFRTRRTRLKAHFINTHKMEETEAEKLVPARLISTSDTQRMNCPLCEHRCLPIMLRKHLFRAHSKELNLEEINMVFEEAIKCKASTEKAQALAAARTPEERCSCPDPQWQHTVPPPAKRQQPVWPPRRHSRLRHRRRLAGGGCTGHARPAGARLRHGQGHTHHGGRCRLLRRRE